MSVDLGTDLALQDAFDPLFLVTSGPRLVVLAVYRRWTTDPNTVAGSLIYKGRCRDVRHLIGSRGDPTTDAGWERGLAECAKEDERVDTVTATLTRSRDRKVLHLRGLITVSGKIQTLVISFPDLLPEVILGQ